MTSSTHAHAFDTGPLSWVIGEIRDALERSGSALNDAAERGGDAQPTLLLHAKTHLHQAHGALLMVDVEGVGALTGAAERVLDAFKEGRLACTLDTAKAVHDAYGAIGEYLDELLGGNAPQPIRLFSYYRALQESLGVERIHPSELLLVDTSITLDLPPPSSGAPDYAALRGHFEKALLPYLKSSDDETRRGHALTLSKALAPLRDAGLDARARTFWSALHSVAEMVASNQLPNDLYIKQLFGQINLQLRRLSQGQAQLPDALLRDALFFIATVPQPQGEAASLRQAFHLEGAVPSDYAERRYGKVDPGALKQAKEALARSKVDWDQLVERADDNAEADFNDALATLAGASDKLGAPALAQLLRELGQAASASIASGRSDQFSLEMATAMLFVEQSLDQVRQLPDDFDEHAEVVGQRLLALAAGATLPDAPQWQNELTRQTQQGQTVAVLAGEIKTGLRQVEKSLDEYYDEPQTKRGALQQAATQLHQVEGALSILDQDAAARAARHVREAVAVLAEGDGDVQAQAGTLHNIARNIGALGFFTDTLAQNSDSAKHRFAFDLDAGLLRELTYEELAALDIPAPTTAPEVLLDPVPEDEFDTDTASATAPATASDTASDTASATAPTVEASATPEAPADVAEENVAQPLADAPVASAPAVPTAAAPAPEADDAVIDAELLEIFIEEADEVLGVVATTLPQLEREPSNTDAMTIVRRAFHTLKGSARMVSLETFGGTAASLERVLNVWLADARAATPDLLQLVAYAHAQLAPWVAELAESGRSARTGTALIAAAERVQAGEAFTADAPAAPSQPEETVVVAEAPVASEAGQESPVQADVEEQASAAQPEETVEAAAEEILLAEEAIEPEEAVEAEAETVVEADASAEAEVEAAAAADAEADAEAEVEADFTESDDAPIEPEAADEQLEALPVMDELVEDLAIEADHAGHDAVESNVIVLPTATRPAPASDDGMRRVGTLDIPLGLYNIYVAETDELLRVLERDFGEWRHEPGRPVTDDAIKAVHTLAGTSSTVGFFDLRDLAEVIETTLEQLAAPAPTLLPEQHDVLDGALTNVRAMLQAFSRGELAPAERETLEQLARLREQLTSQQVAALYDNTEPDLAQHLDTLFEQTYDSLLSEPPVVDAPAQAEPHVASGSASDSQVDDLFDIDNLFGEPIPAEPAVEMDVAPELVAAVDEAVPDILPELVAEADLQSTLDAQAELDGESVAELTFDSDVEVQAEADAEPVAEDAAPVEAELETEAQAEAPSEADDVLALETDAEVAVEYATPVEAEQEAEPQAEAQPEAEFEAEEVPALETDAEPVAEHAAPVEAELEAEPQAEAQPEAEFEAEFEAEEVPALEADAEPVAEQAAPVEAEFDIEPQAEAQPEAEFEAELEAEEAPALEADAEPVAEQEAPVEAELEAEPQAEAQPEIQPDAEEVPALEVDAEPVAEHAAPVEAALETEAQAEVQSAPEALLAPETTEPALSALEVDFDTLSDAELELLTRPDGMAQAEPEPVAAPIVIPTSTPAPETVARPLALDTRAAGLAGEPLLRDDLDPDLLPIFLEEAADLLPQIGNGLRQWQHNPLDPAPAQGLLRTLHTVKGSARMAGAMRIGQHTHELETLVENMVHAGTTAPAAFDELMANYDQALVLFEQLVKPAQAGESDEAETAVAQEQAPVILSAAEALAPTEVRTPLVRVRADILDRMVTQAGEVSITRSRLENQMSVLKGALTDFSDNLARLSRQLREVEMQAESQIASRMSIAGEREFDPLEFDRFTRLQELTRMMAESVNDVGSFYESLSRTVDGADEELAAQSRLTRDLQRDLMRVRMVPFASLSERLFRVARQTAKETDKRVNLDIRGGGVEIDRSVLEQMAAPFEHLLRNAIVHGIEPRAVRAAAGKQETGELLVQVSQQGNEMVLQFSDDGAGLDLERIRAKARTLGLIAPGAELTDAQAAELIFEPGFSTAEVLTELAGRGVGMDVVRAEATALGGRVTIVTEAGRGARFTIRLPLTLAVTQVVLVASAGKIYALPSTLVEQVHQVRESELAGAAAAASIEVGGEVLSFHYLPALLGEGTTFEPGQRSRPVLVLSGAGERGALQVDEVLGNREVVIKNLGPQLARVPGIAGATVLGTGEIVLILNPLALGRHAGSVAHLVPAAPVVEPEQVHRPLVMVVDDSLTVRRVTQRLLEREGFRVALAKDGVDALEQLPEVRPDLMLVDIEMPRMDGFDLVRHVRNDATFSTVPIIMITSRTADKHRNYALGLGVNAYFGKPFQEPVLLAAIAGLLNAEMPQV